MAGKKKKTNGGLAQAVTGNVVRLFDGRGARDIIMRMDGFVNAVTGLGTARDKMSYNRFQRQALMDDETADDLYSGDDMAARVCDAQPEEELRQGYNIVVDPRDTDDADAPEQAAQTAADVIEFADSMGLTAKMVEARVWGRVFGGGVLLIGADDGARGDGMAEPLREDSIKSFDHINVMDKRFVHPMKYYGDPTAAKFGQPMTYLVTPQAVSSLVSAQAAQGALEVHETRLVIFGGVRSTIRTRQERGGWDQSLLQRMQKVLTHFGVSWDSLAHMLQDASQGVFKMKGLIDALASNEEGVVMQRLSLMDMARSHIRSVVLDTEEGEEFERQNFSWSGIKEPFEMMMLRLSSAARTPVTILMGQSPSGMDATGDSDFQQWYDLVAAGQEQVVKPALMRVLKLMMLAKSGPTNGQVPDSWDVTFPSLWQLTPVETADVQLKTAQSDQLYFAMGAATEDEIALSRFSPNGFERPLTVDLEERRASIAAGDLEEDIEDTPVLPTGPGDEPDKAVAVVEPEPEDA